MVAPLRTASITAPAFFGLNTMDSEVTLDPKFARSAENCIIDEGGRIGARKGWQYIHQTDPTSQVDLLGMHRFVDINGDEYFGAWTEDSFYVVNASDNLEAVTNSGTTPTAGNWQAATLNDAAYLFQRGHEPLYFNPTTGVLDDVTSATNSATVTINNSSTVTIANTSSVTLTNSGTVATSVHVNHRLATGDEVVISGANETQYNGTFTITVLDDDTYEYTMSSSPSGDATGTTEANTKIAVVTHSNHDFVENREVRISGANEAGYNGTFEIKVISPSSYYYVMSSIPTQDATGTLIASTKEATVSHSGHPFITGDEITISGATPSDFNGTFDIVVIDNDSYYYEVLTVPTSNPTGTITSTWDKGTPPSANAVLSAYGRLWAADTNDNKTTVYWSDLLDGTDWNSGTAGSLNISSILVKGNDDIVGLGAHNGYLIIFCKNNIIVMGDSDANKKYLSPTSLQLVEVINGVGCIARDTIANTGTDILFLSESGVRSLGRTIQEKSQPMRDISRNIRDTLVDEVSRANKDNIRAVYSDHFAFYLLAIPENQTVYCFDMRAPLQNGSARVTRWNGLTHTNWLSFDGSLYMTNTHGIAEYTGYQDNGSSYQMQYYTNYFDFGMQNMIKIVKNVAATVIGSTGQKFVGKIGTDYEDIYTSYNLTIKEGTVSEYNVDKYGLSTNVSAVSQAADTVTAVLLGTKVSLSAATQANPCQITATSHGLTTGNLVTFEQVEGMTELNSDTYTVTVVDADTFTLDSTDSTGYGAYTTGGKVVPVTHEHFTVDFVVQGAADNSYNTEFKIWSDDDGYYYAQDDGTRTAVTGYVKSADFTTEYSGGSLIDNIRIPAGGSGFVIQLGFESTIDGGFLNIQQIDLYVKQGRLN
jgi:hypothetical protein